MSHNIKSFIVFAALIIMSSPAIAQQTGSINSVGARANPPLGYIQFCRDYAGECRNRQMEATTIALNEGNWRRIVQINAAVNNTITAITDQDHWGLAEKWDFPEDGKGDCEDFVLEKRRRLIKAGFAEQTLLITVVRDHQGDGHAVLTVKTDRGDFVLDNQAGKVLAWQDTGYRFIKRQSDENPTHWVSLGGIDTRNVASARR